MRGSRFSRRGLLIGSSALAAGAAFSHPRAVGRAAAERDHAAADRGGQEGRQGGLVHLDRSAGGRADRKAFRGEISRHRGAGRAHRRRARVAAHRPGICQQHPRRRRGQFVGRRAFASSGRTTAGWRPTCRRTWPSSIRPSTRIRTACSPASASASASSPTTPSLVKKEDAPKSFADLLDPKWKGKIVKAHPGYSGTIMTATFQMSRDLGWGYFEKLAKQNVMQVQSASDPPKKLALGERAVHGRRQRISDLPRKGIGQAGRAGLRHRRHAARSSARTAIFKDAPNPNAARLFQSYCFTPECQQLIIDVGGLRSVHPQVKDKPGRMPLSKIKLMKDDAAGVLEAGRRDQGALRQAVPCLTCAAASAGSRAGECGGRTRDAAPMTTLATTAPIESSASASTCRSRCCCCSPPCCAC